MFKNGINITNRGIPDTQWTLIQEPVPFMEAIEAYNNGSVIKCEIDETIVTYPKTKGDIRFYLPIQDASGGAVSCREILEGKWYIEED